ncbi:TPA: hypothetical protein DEP34_03490 [Candidatus Uhrbacteria bacterium]|uniref:Uncharacterized protein n=2 Tax=Candidatus Uhriibacteriota TaxID=1752732 RepID=A0A0G1Q8H3_9BACT|nr:MAG: hypothetical protein UX45_C0009G0002 [Candidatus Uhrbacteria bacterium GW2011_GWF2_46_218]KKU41299.1 MAG: hypothetical protein UX57_C0004G0003 [Candidatus Uhrbacteria bacterium GW2011_GWE2_46_68]HBK33737.1 hypothetical protein [Candidatus Uhrbacteria bacterium]HCB19422.1 hypothetical protein [Candidatus Uhrbacteria bacterium]
MGYHPQEKRKTLGKDPFARAATVDQIEELFTVASLRHEDYEKPARDKAGAVRGDRVLQISTRILRTFPLLFIHISDDAKVEPCSIKGDGVEKKYIRVSWQRGKEEWGHLCLHTEDPVKPGDTVLCRGFLLCRRVRPVDAKTKDEVGKAAYYLSVDGEEIKINPRTTDLPSDTAQCWLIKGRSRSIESPLLGEGGHWQVVLTHFWFGGMSERPDEIGRDEEDDRPRRPQFNSRSREDRPSRPQIARQSRDARDETIEVVRPTVRPEAPVMRRQSHLASSEPPPEPPKKNKKSSATGGSGKMRKLEAADGNPFAALGAALGLAPTPEPTPVQAGGE